MIINSIESLIDWLKSKNFDRHSLLSELEGGVEKLVINDDYIKIIIRRVSEKIDTIVLDCYGSQIKSVLFNGDIDLKVSILKEKYKHIEERYSTHDDLYFYFFDLKHGIENYTISFYAPNNRKVDFFSGEKLYNLSITHVDSKHISKS